MKIYKITYGILEENEEIIEAKNQEEADRIAYELAIETYESYEGIHGIRNIDDIIEDEDVSTEEAYEIYWEEVETTIFSDAKEIK